MITELKKENFLIYGEIYFVKFDYYNHYVHQIIYKLFNDIILELTEEEDCFYAKDNKPPLFIEYTDPSSTSANKKVGICSIDEKLVPTFIKQLVESYEIPIKIGDTILKDIVWYKELQELLKNLNLEIELKKGPYLSTNSCLNAKFTYKNEYQQNKVLKLFQDELLPLYGPKSQRAYEKKECIIPYFIDNENKITIENTNIIGGVNIPEDIISNLLIKFIKLKNTDIKIGNKIFNEKNIEKFIEKKEKLKSLN